MSVLARMEVVCKTVQTLKDPLNVAVMMGSFWHLMALPAIVSSTSLLTQALYSTLLHAHEKKNNYLNLLDIFFHSTPHFRRLRVGLEPPKNFEAGAQPPLQILTDMNLHQR